MDHDIIFWELENNKAVFYSLFHNLPEEMILWKPSPEKWCLLESICHLYDEEREDFRARVRHTLNNPQQPMQPIDPQGWVLSRNYLGQSYETKLEQFMAERETSIEWLRSLQSPDWQATYQHPKLGPLPAELFLNNWLAHDYLHIRQIIRLKYQYLQQTSGMDLSYAGEW